MLKFEVSSSLEKYDTTFQQYGLNNIGFQITSDRKKRKIRKPYDRINFISIGQDFSDKR